MVLGILRGIRPSNEPKRTLGCGSTVNLGDEELRAGLTQCRAFLLASPDAFEETPVVGHCQALNASRVLQGTPAQFGVLIPD